jgi:hypothetical protein
MEQSCEAIGQIRKALVFTKRKMNHSGTASLASSQLYSIPLTAAAARAAGFVKIKSDPRNTVKMHAVRRNK